MDPKEAVLWLASQQGLALALAHGQDREFDVIGYETWRPRPVNGSMDWIQGNPLIAAGGVHQIRLLGWLSGATLRGQGPDMKAAAFEQIDSGMPGTAILKRRIRSSNEQHDKDALAHLWAYYRDHWRNS